jgi:hypothetical protein
MHFYSSAIKLGVLYRLNDPIHTHKKDFTKDLKVLIYMNGQHCYREEANNSKALYHCFQNLQSYKLKIIAWDIFFMKF